MDGNKITDDHALASNLSGLLHKVLNHHDADGLAQIVLHELGHDNAFKFNKATYLVDNPDFNHLLGVAGYNHCECHMHKNDLWQTPNSFLTDMKDAEYHNSVRAYLNDSLSRKDINLNDSNEVKELGVHLGLNEPHFFSWKMKHGNHGLLLFENKDPMGSSWKNGLLRNVAALLSFCGV